MNALLGLVILYLLGTLAIGVYAGTRIKNSADFAIAGRSLPLALGSNRLSIEATSASWRQRCSSACWRRADRMTSCLPPESARHLGWWCRLA